MSLTSAIIRRMRSGLIIVALLAAGCASEWPTAPTPTPLVRPAIAQMAGLWTITSRVTAASGGDCLGPTLQGLVGGNSITLTAAIQQSGSDLSATITAPSTGVSCAYTGTAAASTFVLNARSCTASNAIGARCPNGAFRDLLLVTGAWTGSVIENGMSGSEANTFNVAISGSGAGVGTFNETRTFSGYR